MTRLRWHIIGLLIWLVGCAHIDRFSHSIGEAAALTPPAGLLSVGVAALLPIVAMSMERMRWLTLFVSALFALGLGATVSLTVGWSLVIGLGLVGVTWFLSEQVALGLREFARSVELITLAAPGEGGTLRSLDAARELVDIEMVRSRRFERPLSLIIVEADREHIAAQTPRLLEEMQQTLVERYARATTANLLTRTLRRTDLVLADVRPGRLVLVTPETNASEASWLASRVAQLVRERMGLETRYGVASFPQQALTFDDLRTVAEADLCRQAGSADGEVLERAARSSLPAAEQKRIRIRAPRTQRTG